jgi:hypothetical protein
MEAKRAGDLRLEIADAGAQDYLIIQDLTP